MKVDKNYGWCWIWTEKARWACKWVKMGWRWNTNNIIYKAPVCRETSVGLTQLKTAPCRRWEWHDLFETWGVFVQVLPRVTSWLASSSTVLNRRIEYWALRYRRSTGFIDVGSLINTKQSVFCEQYLYTARNPAGDHCRVLRWLTWGHTLGPWADKRNSVESLKRIK